MLFGQWQWLERLILELQRGRAAVGSLRLRRAVRLRQHAVEKLEDRTLLSESAVFSIGDASITEGDSGATNVTFVVTRTGDTTSEVTVSYRTSDGTATAGSDYTAVSGSLFFAAGQTTATIKVPVTGDTLLEGNETFFVNLTGISTGSLGDFSDHQSFTTDSRPRAIAIGDLNGDGKRDVAIAITDSDKVSVYLNTTPTGGSVATFASQQDFNVGDTPFSVAIGDLNGDGKPDLAVANFLSDNVSVLLNTTAAGSSSFTFTPSVAFACELNPYVVAIADINGDGKPDLSVSNQGINSVSVLLNQMSPGALTPSFASHVDFDVANNPDAVTVADFNGDGKPDIATANAFVSKVSFLFNTTSTGAGTPTFAPFQQLTGFVGAWGSAAGDINGDGKVDLAIVNRDAGTVSVLLNSTLVGATTFTFMDRHDYPVGSFPHSVALEDLNGDGQLDLVIANQDSNTLSLLFNQTATGATTSSFVAQPDLTTALHPLFAAVADINGDAKPDIIDAELDQKTFSVFLNSASAAGSPVVSAPQDVPVGQEYRRVVAADFNGDGKPDMATVGDYTNDKVAILLNQTAAGSDQVAFAAKQEFDAGDWEAFLAADDFNLDGKPDLVIDNELDNKVTVLLNTTATGATTFSFTPFVQFAADHGRNVATADMNGDGKPDIVVANAQNETVMVLVNTTPIGGTTPSFAAKQSFSSGPYSSGLAVGDLNGDGKPDLAVTNRNNGSVSVLLNTTTSGSATLTFTPKVSFATGSSSQTVAMRDLNSDGKRDLVVANKAGDYFSVFVNTTPTNSLTATFASKQDVPAGQSSAPGEVTIGDVTGDGLPDIVGQDSAPSGFKIFANRTIPGSSVVDFVQVQEVGVGGAGSDVQLADLNGDNQLDVMVSGQVLSSIKVALNIAPTISDGQAIGTIVDDGDGEPPALDLNGTDTPGTGFTAAFVENFAAVKITDTDATLTDADSTELANLKFVISAVPDGANEVMNVAGIAFPLNANKTSTSLVGGTTFQISYVTATRTFTIVKNGGGLAAIGDLQTLVRGVTYENLSNAPNPTSRTISISADDGGSSSIAAVSTVTITPINDPPTDVLLSPATISENLPAGTSVGALTTTDPDAGGTFTYSLVVGAGGTDNGSFTIVNGQLRTAASLDFETKNSYSIRVLSTDQGGLTVEKPLTVTVTNVNEAPTDIALSPASIPENQPIGTVIGTFSTTDPDAGGTFTYSLVSGVGAGDNNSFTISNGQLRAAASFNYETRTSYFIRVRSTDQGGLAFEKQFTISITNVNDAPVDLLLSATSIAENQPVGTVIGSFGSVDPDGSPGFLYSLVSGTGSADNASFNIVNGQLQTAVPLNFEAKSSYSIRVSTTDDGGASFEKTFAISITNVNEAPTDINLSKTSIAESEPAGTLVGVLSSVDQDAGNTFTYALVAGAGSTDNASFTVSNGQLFALTTFDLETKSSYSIRIGTTDQGGLTFEKQFTITITDANDAPTDLSVTPAEVVENRPVGTNVGTFSSVDPDIGNTFTYALVPGIGNTDNAKFTIANGQLLTASSFNFELQSTFSIRVRTTDQGGLSYEKPLTITVTNANEAPTNLSLSATTVAENQPSGAIVGTFSGTDPDTGSAFTFSLVAGDGSTDNSAFTISNGQLLTAATFDFETKFSYAVRVRVTDQGGLSFEKPLTILVTDANEGPTAFSFSPASIAENQPAGSVVGTFSSTDPDSGNTFTYSLVPGLGDTDNISFFIVSGQLRTNASFDFETQANYVIRVRSTDQGGLSVEKAFIVNVTNANEAPVITPDQSFTITENSPANASVGIVASSDPDLTAPFNGRLFSITGGNISNAFSIDPATGQLKVNNAAILDFETNPTILLEISLVDGGGAGAVPTVVTVHLSDVNEAPSIGFINPQTITEDSVTGRITAIVADPETPPGNLTLQATSSNQALIPNSGLAFTGTGTTRNLAFLPLADQAGTTTITITASDGVNTTTRSFLVTVVPDNDAPRVSEFDTQVIAEDTAVGPLTFTIEDPDNPLSSLTITTTSSNPTLIPDTSIVIEGTGTSRTLVATPIANRSGLTVITVTVSDGTLTTLREFQVTVNPADDPPVVTLNTQPLESGTGFHKAVAIDRTATISDIDTPTLNYAGATLKISGQTARDQLSILKLDGIARKGKTVQFNGMVIGTLTGGKKGIPLTVNLNAAANPPAVQALLRHIGFKSKDTAGNRTLQLQITNIAGINTNIGTRTIQIGP